MNACILTLNGGSSSIKFALFDDAMRRSAHGSIERIGLPDARLTTSGPQPGEETARTIAARDHASAAATLLDWLEGHVGGTKLAAVGHRIVHGGEHYHQPQRITREMLGALRALEPLDPQHLPAQIGLIEAVTEKFRAVAQVACFDTAFHHRLPRVAQLLPIPRRYAAAGIRRYGFHGLSYAYLLQELERTAGAKAARGRVILAHLGNGASMAAVRDGASVDTTMGLTPAAGLVMGTRTGDIDPGLVAFLARSEQMTAQEFDRMVNRESGLLGISETSSDMRELLAREASDSRAADAVALFCYQAKKTIGAYAAALGGLETLVFSGGIGENNAPVRERICDGLGFLGIELDAARNAAHAAVVSSGASRVAVRVIPTDEEQWIARAVRTVLEAQPAGSALPAENQP